MKRKQKNGAPKRQWSTNVFDLKTEADTLKFCRLLLQARRKAPHSLSLQVAVTASRKVHTHGGGDDALLSALDALGREL